MSVLPGDIRVYASASTPETNNEVPNGGAIDLTHKHDFCGFAGPYQVVSSSGSDTTQTVTLTYRNADNEEATDTPVTLTGQTPVERDIGVARVLKAVKSATCAGNVALENQTAAHSGTAQGAGGGTDTIQLDTAATTTDDAFIGMVIRLTGGPGQGEISSIIDYDGTTKIATVAREWTTPPTSATTFRIAAGIVFDKTPHEIMTVSRLFYGAAAEATGGAERKYYQRIYYKHTDLSGSGFSVRQATLAEGTDGAEAQGADIKFDIDAAYGDSDEVDGTRLTAPAGFSFDDTSKSLPGNHEPGTYLGVWMELTLPAGQEEINNVYLPLYSGQTPL